MHYLIDGYNLLFYSSESKSSLCSQRQSIVRSLQKEFALLHFEGTVVFDGAHQAGEQSGLSYKSPLVIAYSHHGQSADQYILEKLESSKAASEITVVTNDKFLSSQARGYGAHTLTIQAFLAQLERKHSSKKKRTEEKEPLAVSRRELDRLIKIFEDRLKQDLE